MAGYLIGPAEFELAERCPLPGPFHRAGDANDVYDKGLGRWAGLGHRRFRGMGI